jgi:hypothetical protein
VVSVVKASRQADREFRTDVGLLQGPTIEGQNIVVRPTGMPEADERPLLPLLERLSQKGVAQSG